MHAVTSSESRCQPRTTCSRWFPSGSLARSTSATPLNDVDVIVVYDAVAHPDCGAAAAAPRPRSITRASRSTACSALRTARSRRPWARIPAQPRGEVLPRRPRRGRRLHGRRDARAGQAGGGLLVPEKRSQDWVRTSPGVPHRRGRAPPGAVGRVSPARPDAEVPWDACERQAHEVARRRGPCPDVPPRRGVAPAGAPAVLLRRWCTKSTGGHGPAGSAARPEPTSTAMPSACCSTTPPATPWKADQRARTPERPNEAACHWRKVFSDISGTRGRLPVRRRRRRTRRALQHRHRGRRSGAGGGTDEPKQPQKPRAQGHRRAQG